MNLQHVGSTKLFAAHLTGEWSFSGVGTHVGVQATTLGKPALAHTALVRPDPLVGASVVPIGGPVGELPAAYPARVRLLTSVCPHVDREGRRSVELHSARIAAELRIMANVGPQMLLQAAGCSECPLAHEARVRPDSGMRAPQVDAQIIGFGKPTVAQRAGVRTLGNKVATSVTVEGAGMAERSLAKVASVGSSSGVGSHVLGHAAAVQLLITNHAGTQVPAAIAERK